MDWRNTYPIAMADARERGQTLIFIGISLKALSHKRLSLKDKVKTP
jgi:hypothetical protein